MASKKAEVTTTEKVVANKTVYTVEEFASAAEKVFGTSPDIVVAALGTKHIEKATVDEAKKIVEDFRKKEVKTK